MPFLTPPHPHLSELEACVILYVCGAMGAMWHLVFRSVNPGLVAGQLTLLTILQSWRIYLDGDPKP